MKFIRTSKRLLFISYIFARYRIDEIILHSEWLYSFRFISYFNLMRYLPNKKLSRGQRLRLALERLGPIFVKFGQLLSTRRDLLPPDIADELAKLQDNVKPFSGKIARSLIEECLNKPISSVFKNFTEIPLASASIAQVHAATLLNNEQVVIKILRPHIHKQIQSDVEILELIAKLTHYFLPNAKSLRATEVVQEFELSLNAELNLMQEASNAAILRRNFLHSNLLYIPKIYWDYCHNNMLIMERVFGIPVNNFIQLKEQQINLKNLAENLIETFFTQVFKHNFFHADLHPGNLFVSTTKPEKFIAVDFGIVSSLTESDRRYIAENLLAFFHRDYRKVAELHIASGWVNHDIRVTEFEAAIRSASEPVFEKPLKEISMGQVIMNLLRIARNFNIQIQPQLILLQKTLLHVEGLGRQLYPELDLWKTAKPFLEKWLKEQMGPKLFFKKIKEKLPSWFEKMPEIPDLVYQALINAQQPKVIVPMTENANNKTGSFLLGCGIGFLISSSVSFALQDQLTISGWTLLSLGLGALISHFFLQWMRK